MPHALIALGLFAGCTTARPPTPAPATFTPTEVHRFDEPWAMAALPDGRLLVTQKGGTLSVIDPEASGGALPVDGVPDVAYGGQGGLGDVVLHPAFDDNQLVYLSFAEPGEGDTRGAAVQRARLECPADGPCLLRDAQVIWRQQPKVDGSGHYGHRMVFGPDGHLFITSGDRQQLDPAQDRTNNLGSIVRLTDDGEPAPGNPFADEGSIQAQLWTIGHRNPLGIAFDGEGRLWAHEMGPRGGDELNLIERGENYGWPEVSEGQHYNYRGIPDHATAPQFRAPEVSWTPVISPSGFLVCDSPDFPGWRGTALFGGLSSQALIRVALQPGAAREIERFDMGRRIRAVAQSTSGAIYVLEDGRDARLLRLVPDAPP